MCRCNCRCNCTGIRVSAEQRVLMKLGIFDKDTEENMVKLIETNPIAYAMFKLLVNTEKYQCDC